MVRLFPSPLRNRVTDGLFPATNTVHARVMTMPFVTGKSGLNQRTDNKDLIRDDLTSNYKTNNNSKTKSVLESKSKHVLRNVTKRNQNK